MNEFYSNTHRENLTQLKKRLKLQILKIKLISENFPCLNFHFLQNCAKLRCSDESHRIWTIYSAIGVAEELVTNFLRRRLNKSNFGTWISAIRLKCEGRNYSLAEIFVVSIAIVFAVSCSIRILSSSEEWKKFGPELLIKRLAYPKFYDCAGRARKLYFMSFPNLLSTFFCLSVSFLPYTR